MPAHTLRLDEPLLRQIRPLLGPHQSLAAFVRETLQQEIQRRALTAAGREYAAFLEQHPDEAAWLEEWTTAPLATTRRTRKKR